MDEKSETRSVKADVKCKGQNIIPMDSSVAKKILAERKA